MEAKKNGKTEGAAVFVKSYKYYKTGKIMIASVLKAVI